jgi:hypothetical protein
LNLILALVMVGQVEARTWHVEKDGSGDYSSIFWAMEAASEGDTILIGPGRYDDFHPLVAPAWTTEAIVPVTKDNLTFIGSGKESTIIGPEVMYLPDITPKPRAIATVVDVDAKFIDLGIENAWTGAYWADGRIEVENCRFENYRLGLVVMCPGGALVIQSEFLSRAGVTSPTSIFAHSPCGPLTISNCFFEGPLVGETAISIVGTLGVQIDNCHFDILGAMQFEGSSGTVSNCTTTESVAQSIWVTSASQVEMIDNQFHGYHSSIYVNGWSVATGSGNVFTGGDQLATIFIASQSQVTLNNNHIFKSGEFAAKIGQYFYEIQTNDLTNNYWGTTDTDQIAEWIWDYNDDPGTRAYIEYLPIADGPVPTEPATLGGIKAMYR